MMTVSAVTRLVEWHIQSIVKHICTVLDYEEVELDSKLRHSVAKQIGLPASPVDLLVNRLPCTCLNGVCGCCTGMLLSAFRSKGCMNITYIPEDFAFEVKMMMNDAVLYRRRMSGRNPRPICVNPPRLNFIELCANFYDIYFNGRNMHVCLDMDANFQGYQLFNRSFDCMRLGDQGVQIVKPDDDSLLPVRPQGGAGGGTDADIDAGDDDIDDYDELLSRQLQQ